MYIMLFVNVKSFFPYPNKYKRIYIEEIKIKTLELFFTLDNVVDNRLTQIQECIIKCMTKCCIGIKAPFSFSKYSLYNDFNKYKFKSTVY